MAQDNLAREDAPQPSAFAQLAIVEAENKRLRGWLSELTLVRGDNSLAETLARKVRYIARRALRGESV